MPIGLNLPSNILPIEGIELGCISAEIYRKKKRNDLSIIKLAEGTGVAAVFTTNQFVAAPVEVAKQHLKEKSARYLLINAGNANAGTGARGFKDAKISCESVAKLTGCEIEEVLPFSTGVIGEYLPLVNIQNVLPDLLSDLSKDNWMKVAEAIMTTDTISKAYSKQVEINGKIATVTGICKGSGMIRPNMATMLAYVATDAAVDGIFLQDILQQAVNKSFNRITVDGDMSTNDACILMATGKANNSLIKNCESDDYDAFYAAILDVFSHLAQTIIRDGEGASKFVTVKVENGYSQQDCLKIAYQIAHSPLVKTALNASDANWGRILAAVGSAKAEYLDINKVNIFLNDVCIISNGERAANYSEEQGQAVMQLTEITITIDLQKGNESETVWTTDLSHDYISINADYRT